MTMLTRFKERYGKAIDSRPVEDSVIAKYSGVIPHILVQLWEQDGWGGYMDGFVWTINPEEFEETALRWINVSKGTPVLPILRTAFGDILVWYEGWVRMIDVRHHDLIPIHQDVKSFFDYFLVPVEFAWEEMGATYFPEALKKLGTLNADQCYGFQPLLALGGNEKVENLKVVKLQEHLEILTQAFL